MKTEALLARLLTFLPGDMTHSNGKIGQWYRTNNIFKFPIGTLIELRDTRIFTYGIHPIGVVKSYTPDGDYVIQMEIDLDPGGEIFECFVENGVYYFTIQRERSLLPPYKYPKWDIERHFKAIS